MRRLVICCLLVSGPAAAGESPPQGQAVKPVPPVVHGYCYADSPTVYFSAAFSSPPVGGPGGSTHQETIRILGNTATAWREAFEAYLKGTYGPIGFTQCAMEDSLAKAEAARKALLDDFRRRNPGFTIKRTFVETGWAYASETDTAPVASAPAAEPSKTWRCWMNGMDGSYITQLHPPTGATQIRCSETDPRQAASNLTHVASKRVDWQE